MIPTYIQNRVNQTPSMGEEGLSYTRQEIKRLWALGQISLGEAAYLNSEIRKKKKKPSRRLMWDEQKTERLVTMFNQGLSQTEISRKLGFNRTQINSRITYLVKQGTLKRREPSGMPWTPEEDGIILQYYRVKTVAELAAMIPRRSAQGVAGRIDYLVDHKLLARKRRGYYTRGE